ncbi:hypothetical protein Z517_07573 [Fonsecaea pedrosoi CBS 271.37]|uniref:Unplaced genomic scaffold supercont1.5, whole genome shotgun sequence n=1 Tax=Fonsecaea pedrosoi CBS 271.37 TaxID=1442368 RepID=A0A0D2GGJ3_9EURO|nr:uncharacterized protein Z517_07573 [Fonsecaea pedrosoi CBS 271.37]KIW77740.1 hypothetical protein Z517_07573 [Fonsecaea pedrosoi CBS 271.37]
MSGKNPSSILARLLESGEFSDLKFLCKGDEFKVHKAIVCMQSPVIKAAIQGSFEESHTSVIKMDDFDPKVVKQLVQFMYTGDYDIEEVRRDASEEATSEVVGEAVDGGSLWDRQSRPDENEINRTGSPSALPPEANATDPLLEHIRVNSIGDYYGIEALVSLANSKIEQLLQSDPAENSWVETLPSAIEAATHSTGDQEVLRIFATAIAPNISSLLGMERFRRLSVLTDFSLTVLDKCAREIHALSLQDQSNKYLQQEWERHRGEQDAEIAKLKDSLRTLNRTRQCRNCMAEFTCSIDTRECILRCTKCLCKHQ